MDVTGSARAKAILGRWHEFVPKFVKVLPHDYKRVLAVSGRGVRVSMSVAEEVTVG
jgi:glutamate synthase domain-containing protein 3